MVQSNYRKNKETFFILSMVVVVALLWSSFATYISDITCAAFYWGCPTRPQTIHEKLIMDKLKINKEKSVYFIDLEEILGKQIKKFCIKDEYMDNDKFEQMSSISIDDYEKAFGRKGSTGLYWLKYKDGAIENLDIKHGYGFFEYGNEVKRITCTENPKVVFEQ